MAPNKLQQAMTLRRRGCRLKIITDSVWSAQAIVAFGNAHAESFDVWIEVDVDGHRSGMAPEDDLLLDVGRVLHEGGMKLGGVLAHAGSSYDYDTKAELERIAEQERAGCVHAAQRLRAAGLPCDTVSIGSTPTALAAQHLEGVTEVRAGVYVFFDLVMHNVGVCALDDIALSVLTTVIGHQENKGWAIVDAGWMAMSRDRGTQRQQKDFGYGLVCTEDGVPVEGYLMSTANQEHGIVSRAGETTGETTGEPAGEPASESDISIAARLPIGTRLRILPNHACATGAQHPEYHALSRDGAVSVWPRFYGW
jgi:D-serine deaminase-like pyridoxal phosphate-dependent protein